MIPKRWRLRVPLPRSTRTVWQVLRAHGRIATDLPHPHRLLDPPGPLAEVQADFTDMGTIPAEPEGKRLHVVEACLFEDGGSRQVPSVEIRSDLSAQTALEAVIRCLRRTGLIDKLPFDRDPRWVGSPSGRDFPSALIRCLLCVGVQPNVCPPRQPHKQGYVERLIKRYQTECVAVEQPATEEAAREVTAAFLVHSHDERPQQGRGLGKAPPRMAFPTLPPRPPVPERVDPDRWLASIHGQGCARPVQPKGSVVAEGHHDSIKQALAGQKVARVVNAPAHTFEVWLAREQGKAVPIKGLVGQMLSFEEYAARLRAEARSAYRRWQQQQQRRYQLSLWAS